MTRIYFYISISIFLYRYSFIYLLTNNHIFCEQGVTNEYHRIFADYAWDENCAWLGIPEFQILSEYIREELINEYNEFTCNNNYCPSCTI